MRLAETSASTRGRSRIYAVLAVFALALGFAAVPALAGSRTVTITASQSGVHLTTGGGRSVHVLTQGRYQFVIRDRSMSCGVRLLTTAGIVLRTGRRFVGTIARSVKLDPGPYYYECGSHSGRLLVRSLVTPIGEAPSSSSGGGGFLHRHDIGLDAAVRPRNGGVMFTYRLFTADSDEVGQATYPERIKPGEDLFFGAVGGSVCLTSPKRTHTSASRTPRDIRA